MRKTIILLFAALGLLLTGNVSNGQNSRNRVSKEFPIRGVRNLEVSNGIVIDLVQGSDEGVVVRTIDSELPRVTVRQEGTTLYIGRRKHKRWASFKKQRPVVVTVTVPTIEQIKLSGASELRSVGRFQPDQLTIQLSGASEIKSLNAVTRSCIAVLSGASEMEAMLSGDLSLIASGASEADLNIGTASVAVVKASGSSELEFKGAVQKLKATIVGASDLDAEHLRSASVEVNLAGASEASVFATDNIAYSLSGASELDIYGNPRILAAEVTGASEVRNR